MRKIIIFIGLITIIFTLVGCSNTRMKVLYNDNEAIISESDTTTIHSEKQELNNSKYKGKLEMDGSYTLWKYESQEDQTINIEYLLNVNKGEAKLVYINPSNEIKVLSEAEELTTKSLNIKKGKNRIKIISKNKAKFDLELNIDAGDLEKIQS